MFFQEHNWLYPKFHCIFLIILLQRRSIYFHRCLCYMQSFLVEIQMKAYFFFSIFVANKVFKSFFTKRNLIGHYYFITVYIFYKNRSFMLKIFLFWDFNAIKFYNCYFSIFIYTFKKNYFFLIYNCSTFFSQISILQWIYSLSFAN